MGSPRWEYRTIRLAQDGEQPELAPLGAEGWELICVLTERGQRDRYTRIAHLKRLAAENPHG